MQGSRRTGPGTRPAADLGLSAPALRETLDEVGICTWSLDCATGRVIASPNCRQVLGVSPQCLSDHDAFQALVHREDRAARAAAIREALARGGPYGIEYRVRHADGVTRWVRSHGRAELGPDGKPVSFRGVVYCIDEHRQTEARLQKLQAELFHVSRLSAMGEMVSALAHELNQPLGAIGNYAAACGVLLAKSGGGHLDAARQALDAAVEQAQRAGAIIRRLRDFVTRGETDLREESVASLIVDACALALVGAREQGVEARVDPGPAGSRVLANRIQVQQVLVNLISNAREAMRDVSNRKLMVAAAAPSKGMVRVTVADSGPGIPAAVRKTLFQLFVTTKPHGMGVGLSVSQSIIHAHGGRFWVDSAHGCGATFHFTLPTVED